MARSIAASPLTLRSILIDSSRRRSDRVGTAGDEVSSSSRPPITATSRIRSNAACSAGVRSAFGCCCVMIVLLLLLVVLLLPRESPPRHRIPCWAESCRAYARALEASINSSRDPCDDFYRHVCDRWRPQFGGRSVLEDSVLAFHRSFLERAARAEPPRTSQDSYDKAVALYKSCLAEQTPGVDEFKQFLRDRQLPWPNVDTRVSFLDVALDLSINWHFPVLFYVYRLSAPARLERSSAENSSSAPRLVFTDSFLGLGPHALLEERKLRENNAAHICSLRDALKERGDRESGTKSCEYLDDLQQRILGALTSGKTQKDKDESWAQYESLESFANDLTSSVSFELWVTLFRKYLNDSENFSAATPVEVRNWPHMRRLGTLLNSTDTASLLQLAGLCVVQGLGRFASQELATLIYGDESTRAQRHPDFCYRLVDQVIPRLLYSRDVALLLQKERLEKVNEVFVTVQSSIGRFMRSAAWLDVDARPLALKTVNRARLDYEAILTGAAEGGYLASHTAAATLPDFGDGFLDNLSLIPQKYWEEIHRSVAPSAVAPSGRSPWSFRDLTDTRWADVWRQHDASPFAPHTVALPNLYMLESVFPPDAYESVNYGVVGSLLARQLLTSSISEVRRKGWLLGMPGDGETNGSSRCIQEAFYHRAALRDVAGENPSFSIAMFVAVASLEPLYKALFSSAGYPDWSTGFGKYTANQLFFLALCFPSCGLRANQTGSQDEPSSASWCNVPLMLFRSFSKAFECSTGNGMSASEGCTVW